MDLGLLEIFILIFGSLLRKYYIELIYLLKYIMLF